MHSALVVTPSTCEPMTRNDAKEWLRIGDDRTEDDTIIDALCSVSKKIVEDRTRRLFYQSTCVLHLDGFPEESTRPIRVPASPLKAVASITYYDTADVAQTVSTEDYIVDVASEPGRICLRDTATWPTDLRSADAVAITLTAGYSSSTQDGPYGLPAGDCDRMLAAQKLLLAHLYENRQAVVMRDGSVSAVELPLGVDYLLAPLLLPEVEG